MRISEIIRETVETLRECEALHGVPVIQEDVGDIETSLASNIAKTSVAVVVGWSGFTPVIQGETAPGSTPVGTVGIVASVFEKPVVNRATPGSPTVGDIAIAIADTLNGALAEGMSSPLWLKSIGKVVDLGEKSGVVTCDVNFETKASLN